jgi:hypothetical protein
MTGEKPVMTWDRFACEFSLKGNRPAVGDRLLGDFYVPCPRAHAIRRAHDVPPVAIFCAPLSGWRR